jgi:heme exporter protein B
MTAFGALLWRDLILSLRGGGSAVLAAAFFALIMLLAPLGLGTESATLRSAAPGLLWIAALLAVLLGLERMLQPDAEDGTLDLVRLSPLPLELAVVAKILAHWLTSGLVVTLLAPVFAALLSLAPGTVPIVVVSLLLGTPGLSAIGATAAALAAGIPRAGMLLALLVLPLNVPALIFGAGAVAAAQSGSDPYPPLMFLAAASLVALVLGPIAGAAALRLNEG